ncbi:MAG: aspartyl-tRNA synthetase [Planctomycetota bacterium]|jgi:aspartyl-tRNA synthetase
MTTQSAAAETSANWKRTHTCGALTIDNVGQTVTLNGWVDARRDHGGIYFVDLRDRYGITQVVIEGNLEGAAKIGPEYVLSVTGEVTARTPENVNKKRSTGTIEVVIKEFNILSESPTPPIEVIDELEAAVDTRLRYRYLDLRRGPLQRNIAHRSRFVSAMRRSLEKLDFLEIETPILNRATPEGARDYLVPSRVHPGDFYALPQSPQIFKQILMVSGFDRYYQVARCFRDEDLRADRQPEFTQLDFEMAFVDEEDVFAAWEHVLTETFKDSMDVELQTPFPRMTYDESMRRFGNDKPDVRFGLELKAVDEWARTSDFKVFASVVEGGGRVVGIVLPAEPLPGVKAELSRKEVEALGNVVGEYGAKGLAWWRAAADGGAGPLSRFCKEDGRGAELMKLMGANDGDLCLFVADKEEVVYRALGELRLNLAKRFGLARGDWAFLWVTQFPMFLPDENTGKWTSAHHPFTAPLDWDMPGADENPGEVASSAYDLILNGWELGSGSVRIHRTDVQERVFDILGLDKAEQNDKFGFLLEALAHGAPPHAGLGLGLDRLVALTLGLDNIRDVVPFPKTTSAADLMCGAPSSVTAEQLSDVHIALTGKALALKAEASNEDSN